MKTHVRITDHPAPIDPNDTARNVDLGSGGGDSGWSFVVVDTDLSDAVLDLEPSLLGKKILVLVTAAQASWNVHLRIGTVADNTDWSGVHVAYKTTGDGLYMAGNVYTATNTYIVANSANFDLIVEDSAALKGIWGDNWGAYLFDFT